MKKGETIRYEGKYEREWLIDRWIGVGPLQFPRFRRNPLSCPMRGGVFSFFSLFFAATTEIQAQITKTEYSKNIIISDRKSILATLQDRGRGACQSVKLTRFPTSLSQFYRQF